MGETSSTKVLRGGLGDGQELMARALGAASAAMSHCPRGQLKLVVDDFPRGESEGSTKNEIGGSGAASFQEGEASHHCRVLGP